jgi:NAD(P)-dependent dehydrogenase (short-subunit alcohol dehydrogenase family)
MGWTTDDIPDQTGKVAVVTGANGGLGLEVTREPARKGAYVVMAARDQAKARAAHADVIDTCRVRPSSWSSWTSGRSRRCGQPRG